MSLYETSAMGGVGLGARVGGLVALTKQKQTLLLLATGIGAYVLTAGSTVDWAHLVLGMSGLFLSVSGCTVLNMLLDRDIDAKMGRTSARPLPSEEVTPGQALVFGASLSVVGLTISYWMSLLFGMVVTAGFVLDLGVYTVWLKRRTPFSILFGGVSGGMPALAGRALVLGRIDLVGILLAAGVLLWIPAHILTLATRYAGEYEDAGVPVWPSVYGPAATRRVVAVATLLAAVVLCSAGVLLQIQIITLVVLGVMGIALSSLAVAALIRPSEALNWKLFKGASVYMLGAFVCLTIGAVI